MRAVTLLAGHIYVLCDVDAVIRVYDATSFEQLPSLVVEGLDDIVTEDMVACEPCLYISGRSSLRDTPAWRILKLRRRTV